RSAAIVAGNSHETGGAGQFLTELPSIRSPSSGHQIGPVRSKNKSGSKWGVIPRKGVLSLDVEFFRRGVIALGTKRCQRVWRRVGSRVVNTVSPRMIS
ncbi:unnamed protein product, partial [Prunus brigantina]